MDLDLRIRVRNRAGNRCEYCGLSQDREPFYRFHIEHIIAKQHGGADDFNNLALSCFNCNVHIGTNLSSIDPLNGKIVPLFNPRSDRWQDHFAVEGASIVGLSPSGRATVFLLKMNSPDRIELRIEG